MKRNMINKKYLSSMEGLPMFLTLEMVAALTGLNYETVKRMCQKGKIKATKIGREWRVKQEDLLKM